MTRLFKRYLQIPLINKLIAAFILGSFFGMLSWYGEVQANLSMQDVLKNYVSPFGTIFIQMLKMVVIPIVFFSLIQGASSLPVSKLGQVGGKLMLLYLVSSFLAAVVGILFALGMNPGSGTSSQWQHMVDIENAKSIASQPVASSGIFEIILNMFENPFSALSNSNFLGLIVFAIMVGLGFSAVKAESNRKEVQDGLNSLFNALEVVNAALYKMVTWIMEYAPVGVLALTMVNFGLCGPAIVGPYLKVVSGIIFGIFFMIFAVYGLLIKVFTKTSPMVFFKHIKEPMLTAFVTRSSAAALPISMDAAVNKLGIDEEVASFALPMGATINMDGVCVHLPMFAILAANLFQIPLGPSELFVLVISTVLAAIGTGGVPGGSLMLLFIVLGGLGLSDQNTAVVISLALGVNPILDMFETMNNVAGDLMCTYLVGGKNSKVEQS
ncbi:MAG: dicarboxylate/amino acid:cation symporter [Oligoflexales bacterium]|nr:dicarboxylate/amino acid:cation symporter [Oligoflexales bacterium]